MRSDSAAAMILAALLFVVAPIAAWSWLNDSSQDRAIAEIIGEHGSPDFVTDLDENYSRRIEYRLKPGERRKVFLVLVNGRVVELAN